MTHLNIYLEGEFSKFIHHFRLHIDGMLECLTNGFFYELDDVFIQVLTCESLNATVYLIEVKAEGIFGWGVEYW